MKNIGSLLLLFSVLLACDSLDDPAEPELNPIPTELDGKWVLQNVTCFCFFEEDFNYSAHTVEFRSTDKEVIITNSTETFFISSAGSYSVSAQDDVLTIASDIYYTFEIKGETLKLTFVDNPDIADDEISLFYIKM